MVEIFQRTISITFSRKEKCCIFIEIHQNVLPKDLISVSQSLFKVMLYSIMIGNHRDSAELPKHNSVQGQAEKVAGPDQNF